MKAKLLAGLMFILCTIFAAGCGGSSSGGGAAPSKYAGTYEGTYSRATTYAFVVSITSDTAGTATVTDQETYTGKLTSTGNGTYSGQLNSTTTTDNITFSITITPGSTASKNAITNGSITGQFTQNGLTGSYKGATTTNLFAGNYSGNFTGTANQSPVAGTWTAAIDNKGNATVSVTVGTNTVTAAGTLDPSGNGQTITITSNGITGTWSGIWSPSPTGTGNVCSGTWSFSGATVGSGNGTWSGASS